jgi:manganese/zinc-transporting P-type ATPase C
VTPHARVAATAAGRTRLLTPGLRGDEGRASGAETALSQVPGVRAVRVYPRTGTALVWHSAAVSPGHLAHVLGEAVAAAPSALPMRIPPPGQDGEVARLVVGGALLAVLAFRRLLLRRSPLLGARSAATATVVTLFTGYPFFRGAARSAIGRQEGGTDALVTAATVASLLLRENVVALTVLWLLNIGEFLQALTLRRTRRAIEDLLTIGDDTVWLVTGSAGDGSGGTEVEVALDRLQPGDVVAVHAPSRIPVDGVVLAGEAVVDQAAVTGESLPVVARPGTEVYAGTVLVSGELRARATLVGSETTVGRIVARVESAQADRAPIHTVATRFSRRFVPASFGLAGLTFLVTGDARRAMTMLLVACPCAAGLSTPTAISASIGNGARRGVLIKGGTHLEGAGRISAVVFDKTGTLTIGRPLVTNVVSLAEDWTPEQVLAYAASSEVHARHPLARAVVRHTEEQRIEIPIHEECEVLLGLGVRADLHGNTVLLGSPRLMENYGVHLPTEARDWVDRLHAAAETPVCLAHDARLVGLLGITDAIRPESRQVLGELAALGVRRTVMLTGDSPQTASAVAAALGIEEWYAEALPETKVEVVQKLQAEGHVVAMVGDGTNDAPALALADIGIAMGLSGTDVAVETADIALASNSLPQVADVIRLGRRTLHVVRQNYGLAIGVNTVGLLAGAAGTLNPVLAAVLHNASSVAVVVNSGRLTRYDQPGSAAVPPAGVPDDGSCSDGASGVGPGVGPGAGPGTGSAGGSAGSGCSSGKP